MRIGSVIRHPIDTIRTAPLGSALFAWNAGDIGYQISGMASHEMNVGIGLGLIALNGIGMAVSSRLAGSQLQLRDRLVRTFERDGYNERVMATTTEEWCNRQTARVVSAKYGALEQYEELCVERQDDSALMWLPHV